MKSREVRDNWRDVIDHVRAGNEVVVELYNKPVARIVPHRPSEGFVHQSVVDTKERAFMELINLTPHPLTLIGADDTVLLNQAPDGPMARCAEDRREVGAVTLPDGATVPLRSVGFGAVTDLPDPRDGVLYVVSRATAEAARRDDVVYPDEQVQDADGRIIGCRALARAHT